jgi:hypothetical protein
MLTVQTLIQNQFPASSDTTIRAVRATLHHLSGETSEIVMLIPNYTNWGEYIEEANIVMKEYVNVLTRHWIQISHYETAIGKYNSAGEFLESFPAWEHIVPVGKVYAAGTPGQFLEPKEHPNYPNYGEGDPDKELTRLLKLVSERKEEVYNKIDETTTLVGIPVKSKEFYFHPNQTTGSHFLFNKQRYLTVYKITHVAGASKSK